MSLEATLLGYDLPEVVEFAVNLFIFDVAAYMSPQ